MRDPDNEEPTEDIAIDSRDLLKVAGHGDETCPRCGEPLQLHRIDQAQFMSLGRAVRLCADGRPTFDLLPLRNRSTEMAGLDAFLRPQAEIDLADADARRLRAQQLNASFANAPTTIGEVSTNIVRELDFTLDHLVVVCTNGAVVHLSRWELGPLAPTANPAGPNKGSFWPGLNDWTPVLGGTAIRWSVPGVPGGYIVSIPQPVPDPHSFATAPVSIAEARAKREQSAAKWSPRDALVNLLREIDSGETKITALVVTFAAEHEDGRLGHGFRNAAPDNFTALGLLARASHRLQED